MTSSPKRKRGHVLPLETKGPLLQWISDVDLEQHQDASPRTKVARKFDDLEIDGVPSHRRHDIECQQTREVFNQADMTPLSAGLEAVCQSPKSKERHDRLSESGSIISQESGKTSASAGSKPTRSKSPPLDGEISDRFWHGSEITGHIPDDPNDDGYGINGIGFRPTAAIAWSRSQRRKQQLTEYKSREAREARQQRSERRKRLISESDGVPSAESLPRKSVRVHFEDG
ncbi:uncharacterized protein Z518_08151 [Rhinocladiella mackenziei CBS 650.93]|uniref:Uncharacterized protein n=1 Tax=Rhinocladiella mackenziei CBS 650.93 TaxID=1442369 RepID=A0A0D2FJS9_9EURO|nr:uncharacterized protein Z518_08151 [Rhinocladiella mackenziei CBS 650.93]KIX02212.1 hypothetical protein Z518_08151 [Rhinocladiella mackenziei CBS 650.93]